MVIWITGLSGSGKSTFCNALRPKLMALGPCVVTLDGDAVRAAFGNDLGYREADRVAQIKRMQGLAKLLADQGIAVLVAALYARPDLLDWNRANLPGYFEIYLKIDMELLFGRDPKGLYRRARSGEMPNVVGVDIPWHSPLHSDLVVDASLAPPVDALADDVLAALRSRGAGGHSKARNA
jgi:adenylylsulfate kinase-like enzyme